jgi:hypothetical protein
MVTIDVLNSLLQKHCATNSASTLTEHHDKEGTANSHTSRLPPSTATATAPHNHASGVQFVDLHVQVSGAVMGQTYHPPGTTAVMTDSLKCAVTQTLPSLASAKPHLNLNVPPHFQVTPILNPPPYTYEQPHNQPHPSIWQPPMHNSNFHPITIQLPVSLFPRNLL